MRMTLEDKTMEEQKIAKLNRLGPLLEEIKIRKAKYGCTTIHAYERIMHERRAEKAVRPYMLASENRFWE